ncbi:MAG: DUF134 domain-containing protein [Candidatus Geothermincolia bacterium]
MARPLKTKLVRATPRVDYFKPRGIPVDALQEILLTMEELETLRLVDSEGLYQEEAARVMGISRPTLQRLLTAARSKVAEALLRGKALRIEGGNYVLGRKTEHCCSREAGAGECRMDSLTQEARRTRMKLAVVTEGEMVSQHFGRSEGLLVAEIENGAVVSTEKLQAPEHDCSALPLMMRSQGVQLAIVGGLGAGAMQHLISAGIDVIAGVSGNAEAALQTYLAGGLTPGEATCAGDGGCHGHAPEADDHDGQGHGPCVH